MQAVDANGKIEYGMGSVANVMSDWQSAATLDQRSAVESNNFDFTVQKANDPTSAMTHCSIVAQNVGDPAGSSAGTANT